MEEILCGICYEKCNSNNIMRLICAHIFCRNCIIRSLKIKNICPICRITNDEESMVEYIKKISLKEYNSKSFIWVYENDKKYCLWCKNNYNNNTNFNPQFEVFVKYIKQKNNIINI